MKFILASIAIVSSLAAAAPAGQQSKRALSGDPFNITSLDIIADSDGTTKTVTLSFNVHDPEPHAPATAHCNATWAQGSDGYPHDGYVQCNDTDFSWEIQTHNSDYNFTLGITHSFADPDVGAPDRVTTFARGDVTNVTFACEVFNADSDCSPYPNDPILAPVYAITA